MPARAVAIERERTVLVTRIGKNLNHRAVGEHARRDGRGRRDHRHRVTIERAIARLVRFVDGRPDARQVHRPRHRLGPQGTARSFVRPGPRVRVIFISAYDRAETLARALDAGADDYLVKPFSATDLTARVRGALRRGPRARARRLGPESVTDERGRSFE